MENYWKSVIFIIISSSMMYLVVLTMLMTGNNKFTDLNTSLCIASALSIIVIASSMIIYIVDERKRSKKNEEPPTFSLAVCSTALALAIRGLWSCLFRPNDFWNKVDLKETLIFASIGLFLSVIWAVYLLYFTIKQEKSHRTSSGFKVVKPGWHVVSLTSVDIIVIYIFFLIIQTLAIWWIAGLFLFLFKSN